MTNNNKKLSRLLFSLLIVAIVSAENTSQVNAGSLFVGETSISNAVVNMTEKAAQDAEIAKVAKQWEITTVENNSIFMLQRDGLSIPIQMPTSSLVLNHEDRGRFIISNGKMSSLTRTPVTRSIPVTAPFTVRPTLFITLEGLRTSSGKPDNWQINLNTILHREIGRVGQPRYSQLVHFLVNWESNHSNFSQTQNLGDEVNKFLNQRGYPWDVVIFGFSRGGIFAHDLAAYIRGHANINMLHTFLLDPTAAAVFGDSYPKGGGSQLTTSTNNVSFGSLFYDNKTFADQPISDTGLSFGGNNFIRMSDFPIPGYDNYGRNDFIFTGSKHKDFGDNWTGTFRDFEEATIRVTGMSQALTDIWNNKSVGQFIQDGITNPYEIIIITEDEGPRVGFRIGIGGGNLKVAAYLSVNKMLPAVRLDATVGFLNEDGAVNIDAVIATGLYTAQVKMNKDGAAISTDTSIGVNVGVGVDYKEAVYAEAGILDELSASALIGKGDVVVNAKLFGTKVELKLSKVTYDFKRAEDRAKRDGTKLSNELKKAGTAVSDAGKDIGTAASDAAKGLGNGISDAVKNPGKINPGRTIGGWLGF